ncbi:MAG: cofC [Solirubrobacterales bacterium]|jgi:2-phospho-L-lactate guanylyltransferase|nr:cofC [Solirubrobacterales bacterium]
MSAALRTIAVLPVKRFASAKQRLAEDFSAGTRRAIVEAMVTDVLVALRRSTEVDQVLVVTRDLGVEALAHGYDADTVGDPEERSHSDAAVLGVREAIARGARRVVLVPGDCPALNPKELDALLQRAATDQEPAVVVVPDRHGDGTNALVLTPPDAIIPSFGPGSHERHVRAANDAGARVAVDEVPSLVLDVDTADDLDALREALGTWHGNAAHTRGMLSRLGRL